MIIKLEEAEKLIKFARDSINSYFSNINFDYQDNSHLKTGLFVTLYSYPDLKLRGCIGFIEPIHTLYDAVFNAARLSAFNDPRFPKLKQQDLDNIILEINILSKPELITDNYLKKIIIGKDGLIIHLNHHRSLLLPGVAVEYNWTSQLFLEQTCIKANLKKNSWQDPNCKVYKFQTQIFKEKAPNEEIIEVVYKK